MSALPTDSAPGKDSGSMWREPIAIVGIGCRWPGEASSPSKLWDLLQQKKSAYSDFPSSKVNWEGFYHPEKSRVGSFATKGGYFLAENPYQFDHAFFGITPLEAQSMDPAQRKLLEVAYEAFESAGARLEGVAGSRTGCYIGNYASDHRISQLRDIDNPLPYSETGSAPAILSNRISHVFNLTGPSLTLDTASSSALYALHLACSALLSGDCDACLAGGSNIILSPDVQILGTKMGTLSAQSKCSTFDADADGYGRGEGFAIVYLKTLSKAVEDGDSIQAVIRGTAVNANGRTGGISHPNVEGQERAIRHAYKVAGLDPGETGYFECHGTGTSVGDPIEAAAIGRVFASTRSLDSPLLIGAIKPNIGHSESAAGFAGLIKSVLAVHKGVIPPTIAPKNLNPAIDFEGHKLRIVTSSTPWPTWTAVRRASINCVGYGGTNAHAIIENADSALAQYYNTTANGINGISLRDPSEKFLLAFSAQNEDSLSKNMENVWTAAPHHKLSDVAFTVSCKRSSFYQRAFTIAGQSSIELPLDLDSVYRGKRSSPGGIGFIFTGQGAQWAQMGKDLMAQYSVFSQSLRSMDRVLKSLDEPPSWTLEDVLLEPSETSRVNEAVIAQPLCTALQVALIDLLESWGIVPQVTIGHSSGEIAASYAAGYITSTEAIVTAYYRGKVVDEDRQVGAMMAVGLGEKEVAPFLEDFGLQVRVACVNSPSSTTLSGDTVALKAVKGRLEENNIFVRFLHTGGKAYHSHMMAAIGDGYESAMKTAFAKIKDGETLKSKKMMFSSVHGRLLAPTESMTPAYWRQNLESKVRFSEAMLSLIGCNETPVVTDTLIELGPAAALKGPVNQILKSLGEVQGPQYHASLLRNSNSVECLLQLAGKLFIKGHEINFAEVNNSSKHHAKTISDLPTYSFQYGPVLHRENRASREFRMRKHLRHDMLGYRVPGVAKECPVWRNVLKQKDLPWLSDYKVDSTVQVPVGGFVGMVAEATSQLCKETGHNPAKGYTIKDFSFSKSLVVPDDEYGVELFYNCWPIVSSSNSGVRSFGFLISSVSSDDDESTEHCRGTVTVDEIQDSVGQDETPIQLQETGSLQLEQGLWYAALGRAGREYGQSFRGLSSLRASPGKYIAFGEVSLQPTKGLEILGESTYLVHPATFESCLQLAIIADHSGQPQHFQRPITSPLTIGEMYLRPAGVINASTQALGSAWKDQDGERFTDCHAQLVEGDTCLLKMKNLAFTYGESPISKSSQFHSVWKPDIDCLSAEEAQAMWPPMPFRSATLWEKLDCLAINMIVQFHEAAKDSIVPESLDLPLQRFWDYMVRMTRGAADGSIGHGRQVLEASPSERASTIEQLSAEIIPDSVVAEVMKRMYDYLGPIFDGTTTGQEVCFKDDLMSRFYIDSTTLEGAYMQLRRVMDLLGHKDSRRNILELGGGTGGATRVVLDVLKGRSASKLYNSYTFTDVSTYFLGSAQDEFRGCGNMSYTTIDFEVDPQYSGEKYDMVIASNCLHVAADVGKILQHVRQFLKPGGKLVLVEVTNQRFWAPLLAGGFSDYWKGTPDGRLNGPYCPREKWADVLKPSNGFSGLDIVLDDYTNGHVLTSVILATAIDPVPSNGWHQDPALTVVAGNTLKVLADATATSSNHEVMHTNFAQYDRSSTRDGRFIVLSDACQFDEDEFDSAKDMMCTATSILWVVVGNSPDTGLISGLVQGARQENRSLKAAVLRLCFDQASIQQTAERIIEAEKDLLAGKNEAEIETAFCNGQHGFISRWVPAYDVIDTPRGELGWDSSSLPQQLCSNEGRYVLVNCLGTAGKGIIRLLVDNGANDLLLFYTGVQPVEYQDLLYGLEGSGVSTQVISGASGSVEGIHNALASSGKPVMGAVFMPTPIKEDHMSTELTSARFREISDGAFTHLQNLHTALQAQPVKFFIMENCSESKNLWYQHMTDSAFTTFARHRQSLGLPAHAVSFSSTTCTTSDVSDSALHNEQLALLETLEGALSGKTQQHPAESYTFVDPSSFIAPTDHASIQTSDLVLSWEKDQRFQAVVQSLLKPTTSSTVAEGTQASVQERLQKASSAAEYANTVAQIVVEKLAVLLFVPEDHIEHGKSLADYGMDSMIAADLKAWAEGNFGVELSFFDLLSPEIKIRNLMEGIASKRIPN